jgi:hypothetical protein
VGDLAELVLVLDGEGGAGSRGVVDALEDGVDEVHSLLLEAEVLGQGGLRELHIEVDRLAGVSGGNSRAEEVVPDVIEEHHALLPQELDLEGRKQSTGVRVQSHPALLPHVQKGLHVVLDELILHQLLMEALVGQFVLLVDLAQDLLQLLLRNDLLGDMTFVGALNVQVSHPLALLLLQAELDLPPVDGDSFFRHHDGRQGLRVGLGLRGLGGHVVVRGVLGDLLLVYGYLGNGDFGLLCSGKGLEELLDYVDRLWSRVWLNR